MKFPVGTLIEFNNVLGTHVYCVIGKCGVKTPDEVFDDNLVFYSGGVSKLFTGTIETSKILFIPND